MNMAIILHTLLRLARPGTVFTLIMFVIVWPTALVIFVSRAPNVSFDFDALLNLFIGPIMINLLAFTFISSSVGNTKSLDDGEYLGVLFSRPVFRWEYVISKWIAGTVFIVCAVTIQTVVFLSLLLLIGRGSSISISLIDLANLILNAIQASALVVMVFSFPSRIGAIGIAGLAYLAFFAPLMLNSLPNSEFWLNGHFKSLVAISSGFLRSLMFSSVDLDPYFNSIQVFWLPAFAFVSNIAIYLWVAIVVMNKREFFYSN